MWKFLWWECKPTFGNASTGNTHFDLDPGESPAWAGSSGRGMKMACSMCHNSPPTHWYPKMQIYFLILPSTSANGSCCFANVWSNDFQICADNSRCEHSILHTHRPPSPSPFPIRKASVVHPLSSEKYLTFLIFCPGLYPCNIPFQVELILL